MRVDIDTHLSLSGRRSQKTLIRVAQRLKALLVTTLVRMCEPCLPFPGRAELIRICSIIDAEQGARARHLGVRRDAWSRRRSLRALWGWHRLRSGRAPSRFFCVLGRDFRSRRSRCRSTRMRDSLVFTTSGIVGER